MTKILNKKKFFKWLRRNFKTLNYTVENDGARCRTCPIATFLKFHGAESPMVGPNRYRLNDEGLGFERQTGWIPLPKWAQRVVSHADRPGLEIRKKYVHTFGQLILDLRHAGVRP